MSGIMLNVVGGSFATVPGAPTIGTATATGATTATVSYTAPVSNGGSIILSYTATSSPGGLTGTLSQAGSGTITVNGLSANTAYTFTVTATNAIGTSAPSSASNSITIPGSDIAIGNDFPNQFAYVYPWVTGTGFGTKYADPASSTGGYINTNSVKFSSAGTTLVVGAGSGPPGITAYPFISGTGLGVKYANPSAGFVNGNGPAFNPSINAVAIGGSVSPYVNAWAWSSGFGAKYADPVTVPPALVGQVAWNPAGTVIATAHNNTMASVYDWSSGFGSKYADPASVPCANAGTVSWNNNGTYIAFGDQYTSPYVVAYPWSSGFGSRVSNPATLPNSGVTSVQFNSAGTAIAVAEQASPFIDVYAWSSGFGSKYANPSTLPPGLGFSASFNAAGNTIALGGANSPFISVYPWSPGFGSKYANPSTLPVGGARGVSFAGTF